jgi:phospholipid-binding lipoprotein MlaA
MRPLISEMKPRLGCGWKLTLSLLTLVHTFSAYAGTPSSPADEPASPNNPGSTQFIFDIAQVTDPVSSLEREPIFFIYDIAALGGEADRFPAQASEVTILMEKKMVPYRGGTQALNGDPETQLSNPDADALISADSDGGSFEDLEDPFAEAGSGEPVVEDPFEGYNRFMFDVNEGIYDYVMEPVARGYRYVLPIDIRIIIRNLFHNASAPVRLVSSLLQGELNKSGRVLGRFLINTTAGLGGMFDVAGQEYEIAKVNEDMEQALGAHEFPTGPYIVLPFFGPSTGRGVAGRVFDTFLSPTVLLGAPTVISTGLTVEETVNNVSFIIDDKKALEQGVLDPYESMRDFHLQYRKKLLRE